MKIAVPLHQGRFSEHFGGAEEFALYTVDQSYKTISERMNESPPEHGRGIFPMWLRDRGATVVLAGGMGPRAVGILAQHGIEVVLGIRGEDPDALVHSYLQGNLEGTGEMCHDHGFHDCTHHHDETGHGGRGGCHNA
jgi:predicted Fe-Mo cluster-binding NifX family protein